MLYILFTTIILLPALMGFGSAFVKIFGSFTERISAKIILGIFSVTIIYTVLAFFFPLDLKVEIPALLIGIAAFFYFKQYKICWDFIASHRFLFPVLAAAVIFFGSYYPFILDHFGYYVPTVKWISEVGLVKGISNLDLILGQMSFWHIFQAGFSNFSDPFLRMNTVVLIVYLIYILEKKSWIHLVFLPVLLMFSQSPSTDLPVIAFSLIVLNEIFNSNKNSALLFGFSVFIFAIKPTMIWVPVFSFLYSAFILKSSFKFTICGILVLLLFFIKNIWTFGFPIFPVQILDFGFSWKPNAELLKNSSQMAIQKTYDMQFSYSQIENFSYAESVKNWFLLTGMKGKINMAFIVSLVAFLAFVLKKNTRLLWLLLVSIIVKSVAVLLFSAQYRFFIDVFFVVFFAAFFQIFSRKFSIAVFFMLSFILSGFLSFPNLFKNYLPSFRVGSFMGGFKTGQFFKPSHYEWNRYRTYQIGNLKFNVVEAYPFSFDIPVPAISPQFIQEYFDAGIFPQLKGKSIKDGFVWKEINADQKLQVRKILDEFQKSLDKKK